LSIAVSSGPDLWRFALETKDATDAESAAAALAITCQATSFFEASRGGSWQVEGLAIIKPDRAIVEAALSLAWIDRSDPPAITLERVPARDWLAENQAGFPPLEIGRFFIFGSHFSGQVPPGRIGILIDAATAFGTGEHPTTRGCLAALDALARRRPHPRRVLDMGTGTGILALAAAKSWRRRIDARDTDPEAARVAIVNARRNGAARWIAVEARGGYRDRGLKRKRPFDLVVANILARPLIEMAPDLARALAPGGIAILSGLLARQEAAVLAAHRAQGMRLLRRISTAGWNTLVVARRSCDPRSG